MVEELRSAKLEVYGQLEIDASNIQGYEEKLKDAAAQAQHIRDYME